MCINMINVKETNVDEMTARLLDLSDSIDIIPVVKHTFFIIYCESYLNNL